MSTEEKIMQLRNIRDIQGESGNWNYNPYMLGMYNGIELALATLEDREPDYREKPDEWLQYRTASEPSSPE